MREYDKQTDGRTNKTGRIVVKFSVALHAEARQIGLSRKESTEHPIFANPCYFFQQLFPDETFSKCHESVVDLRVVG